MRLIILMILMSSGCVAYGQSMDTSKWWHDKIRTLRYHPDGEDFVITNGNRRFTRALYGTNTAFRAEAGDLPEFALYMPGMGGNIKFGLINKDSSKWLINADKITARYRAGSMLYDIEDILLGKGTLHITVLALADAEGIVIKIQADHIPSNTQLIWAYGGATGKKFSRDGDMGPDPESSFYLKPEYCTDNRYTIGKDHFTVRYGTGDILSEEDRYENKNLPNEKIIPQKGKEQFITGIFPSASVIHLADASKQSSPNVFYQSGNSTTLAITGSLYLADQSNMYVYFSKTDSTKQTAYTDLPIVFDKAENARKLLANRIKINTPDPYLNNLGGALSVAADAIWESPSYLHGSIGWRIRLNGWRGPYVGDVLGWHDRARLHFTSYAQSQVLQPESGKVVADTALHLARQAEKMGTSVFSSGYISRNPGGDLRPHHYDMNLVYIDELLWHFKWTGDIDFIKEMWPVIKRHLAWEKRNFDSDDDGLYDAYAAIWASDALQYSGGSVTHSSAYNYRANTMAAQLAVLLGEDPKPFREEAIKIKSAVDRVLWMKHKGWYAEYKDALGMQSLHPDAALWTIYHSIDSDLPDAFQAYQSAKYIDANIPHIPVKAKGLENGLYTVSTSNWMPYEWSLNNVVLAELMHTSLAQWEAGRSEEAFVIWKSALIESMYLGGSPGNFQQISTYDAIRGEAYRDFGDPVGMTARSLVQGLFGILPDALNGVLTIRPGFPQAWNHASVKTPDIDFRFKRNQNTDNYILVPAFEKTMRLQLIIHPNGSSIQSILVNGKKANWKNMDTAISNPVIEIDAAPSKKYQIMIVWNGMKPMPDPINKTYINGSAINISLHGVEMTDVYDPQKIFQQLIKVNHTIHATIQGELGSRTAFIKIKQGAFSWWQPQTITIKEPVEIYPIQNQQKNILQFALVNNTTDSIKRQVLVNGKSFALPARVDAHSESKVITVPYSYIQTGSNEIIFHQANLESSRQLVSNWNIEMKPLQKTEAVDMHVYFNDKVTNIFRHQYLSPRPATATLQLPTQGIGEWTHPLLTATINDLGFRNAAANNNTCTLPQGISFQTPSDTTKPNILFTSQWDNFPKEATIPLSGKSSHAYFLMAGSTNPMQSHMTNGAVIVLYEDASSDTLLLTNPENWWPIEQDYYNDGYAFKTNAGKPIRIHLKTGIVISGYDPQDIRYNGKMIEGGAATILDMTLNPSKMLKALILQTRTNDVVIGLMGVSLTR
jgi:hypothetical protein